MRNKVQLIGNLGDVPELRTYNESGRVARVKLATNDRYKNAKGEYVKETTWHTLVLWGKMAENAGKLFRKGTELVVEGKIVNGVYENREGQKRNFSEVHVENFILIGHPSEKN